MSGEREEQLYLRHPSAVLRQEGLEPIQVGLDKNELTHNQKKCVAIHVPNSFDSRSNIGTECHDGNRRSSKRAPIVVINSLQVCEAAALQRQEEERMLNKSFER